MADLKWIKHDGGAMPVPGDVEVAVRVESGRTSFVPQASAAFYRNINNWWDGTGVEKISEYAIVSANDPVTKPAHYASGAIECIDAIRSALTPDEFRGYCKGNMLKYAWRERGKNGDEDLRKAAVYAGFATEASDNG